MKTKQELEKEMSFILDSRSPQFSIILTLCGSDYLYEGGVADIPELLVNPDFKKLKKIVKVGQSWYNKKGLNNRFSDPIACVSNESGLKPSIKIEDISLITEEEGLKYKALQGEYLAFEEEETEKKEEALF